MMLSVMVVGAGAAFSDQSAIKNTEAVDACTALNIIGGYPDGSFKPEGNITRAEVTKMICVALNGGKEPAVSTNTTPTFSDVRGTSAAWAEGYIESCAAQGIVSGVGAGKFAPAGNVTGVQLAKMLLVALGYKADIEGFTGNAWATNVNVRAAQKGLYEDLESMDTNAAITRDNAAQMVWNALQAKEVKYDYTLVSENGQLTSKTTLVDKDLTLLKDKYDSDITKGVVTAIGHNSKGYLVTVETKDKDSQNNYITVNLSKVEKDPTDLVGKAVKALYKATDDVYGIYLDDENTATVVNTTLGDIDLNKDEYKLDGVTYKVKTGDFGAVEAVGALGAKLEKANKTDAANLDDVVAAIGNYAISDASKVVLIDNDGDEKIDIAVVTPVQFGEITYLNSKNITVKGVLTNAKLEDCDIYKDAAKDDQVAVIADTYNADENTAIVKLTSVTGKVQAVKSGEARVDGTWYDVAVFDGTAVKVDDKGTFYLYNGYIVAVDTTGGSISDTAYIISSSTSMDANGDYQAKVMINGETKVVPMKNDTGLVAPGSADIYCTYEVDDGTYEFTAITAGSKVLDDEYTSAAVLSYEDGRLYSLAGGKNTSNTKEFLIDDDAVIFVKYNKDKHVILTGKDVANWGDKVKNFNTTSGSASVSQVLFETTDSMKKVKGAFIDLAGDKMPASTASYGVIVSDIVSATDDKNEFTLWNGTDAIEVTTSDSGFAKWQVVEYVKNNDDTYDIDAVAVDGKAVTNSSVLAGVTTGYGLYSIVDHTSNVVQLANNKNSATNYNITKDTQIIYVDTSASDTEDSCVNGGSISDAGYAGKTTDGKDTYYRNATFVIDDGSDLDLLVVITNTKDAHSGVIKAAE